MGAKIIDNNENGNHRTDDTPIWLIYSGTGTDGGFGDYAEPVWDEEPVRTRDGHLLWFTDKENAEHAADILSKRESNAFYSKGCHDAYDGDFPTEFRAFKTYVPVNMSAGGYHLDDVELLDTVAFVGQSSWGAYTEDGSPIEEDDEEQEDENIENADDDNLEDNEIDISSHVL